MEGAAKREKVLEEEQLRAKSLQGEAIDAANEVDEEEKVDEGDGDGVGAWRMAQWGELFKEHLGVKLGSSSVGSAVTLITCGAGPGTSLAMAELAPPGYQALVAATEQDDSSRRLVKNM